MCDCCGTDQVPFVASDVEEHCDAAVRLDARFGHEVNARSCYPRVCGIEVLHVEEETYPARRLVADHAGLNLAVSPREEQACCRAWRPHDHPALGTAVIGDGRGVLRELEAKCVNKESDCRVVLADDDSDKAKMHRASLGNRRSLSVAVMGDIQVGTASWTDRTLIESGWYPPEANNPARRLGYYARQFPLVEVDATYYALPAEQTAEAWVGRTPAGFTFNIKAFSLFTQHPTRVAALPADLRDGLPADKQTVYLRQVDPALADSAWERFLAALEPLRAAGKLGAILFQFPQWFPISRASKNYILSCAERVAPRRMCVEFRNRTWMTPDNQQETLQFLSEHDLPYVSVDMPQGYPSSIPPVLAATADLAVVRLHGHSDQWTSKDIHERFGYRYSHDELTDWAQKISGLASTADDTQVLFNNCYRDYAQVNASELKDLLATAL